MKSSNASLSPMYLIVLRNMKQDYTMPQYFFLSRKHLLTSVFRGIWDSIIPPKLAQLCNFKSTEDSPVFWSEDCLRIQEVKIYKCTQQCEAASVLFHSVLLLLVFLFVCFFGLFCFVLTVYSVIKYYETNLWR